VVFCRLIHDVKERPLEPAIDRRQESCETKIELVMPRSIPGADRFVVISGCSGAGKSTLLNELSRRGHATVEEPGRRIVEEELSGNGSALPGVDAAAFARRTIALAVTDHAAASRSRGWVFFDRSLSRPPSKL
jgi:predicted ATPase